jgi:hypothetical protein
MEQPAAGNHHQMIKLTLTDGVLQQSTLHFISKG